MRFIEKFRHVCRAEGKPHTTPQDSFARRETAVFVPAIFSASPQMPAVNLTAKRIEFSTP